MNGIVNKFLLAGDKFNPEMHLIQPGGQFLMKDKQKGLDDTILSAEAGYPIDFTQPIERFVLSSHYNGSNSFLFVNATKVYQFKSKRL